MCLFLDKGLICFVNQAVSNSQSGDRVRQRVWRRRELVIKKNLIALSLFWCYWFVKWCIFSNCYHRLRLLILVGWIDMISFIFGKDNRENELRWIICVILQSLHEFSFICCDSERSHIQNRGSYLMFRKLLAIYIVTISSCFWQG